ncbi:MAG: DUF2716 domain-containing protein, partial [Rhodococcus sp. (in: high G+C Gram-positive bacteria)]
ESKYGFRPGTKPASWPAIAEPTPSMTFDLDWHSFSTLASSAARRGRRA